VDALNVAAKVRVKICGITNEEDAELVVGAGAELMGLNLVPSSKRYVTVEVARRLADLVRGRVEIVVVVADLTVEAAREVRARVGADSLQHHGSELPELFELLPASDFKAVRVATRDDAAQALTFRGPRVLLDAKVGSQLGGTGHRFDWSLAREITSARQVLLAGGLTPDNVADAVREVRPWAVDVASGVEVHPRKKDPDLVWDFINRARSA
jgi:phosphoribosylanthranilate isomerase